MAVETNIYNNHFFKNTIKFEADSAAQFVDVVLKYYQPLSIIDVGCGAGIYLKEFEKRGIVNIFGLDGSPAAADEFLLNHNKLVIFDLANKYQSSLRYDLAICLEVAEHLEERDADTLVESLCGLSSNIVFSAAIPGQGPRSIGHINEQPHSYWISKFKLNKYIYQEKQSLEMRAAMEEKRVVWWIVNNLMIFKKTS
jgi:2-polyprenyl-3-methyl-5-hydroxy-6-metoxy-1,4-benzoquinol methylase